MPVPTVLSLVISSAMFILGLFGYVAVRTEYLDEKRRKLRQSTLDDIARANPTLTRMYFEIRRSRRESAAAPITLAQLRESSELHSTIFDGLDALHFLGVGLLQNNYDEATFVLMIGQWYRELFTELKPLIREMRELDGRQNFYAAIIGTCDKLNEIAAEGHDPLESLHLSRNYKALLEG